MKLYYIQVRRSQTIVLNVGKRPISLYFTSFLHHSQLEYPIWYANAYNFFSSSKPGATLKAYFPFLKNLISHFSGIPAHWSCLGAMWRMGKGSLPCWLSIFPNISTINHSQSAQFWGLRAPGWNADGILEANTGNHYYELTLWWGLVHHIS